MADETILRGSRFQVRFFRADDRYGHVISRVEGEAELPLLTSAEGSADDLWPPSPALQGVHLEHRGAQHVAMLVGMAGSSHWSAAVTLAASEDGEELRFELACRASRAPAFLGSNYRLARGLRFDAEIAGLHTPQGKYRIRLEYGDIPRTILTSTTDGFAIQPRELDLPLPATWRWGYAVVGW